MKMELEQEELMKREKDLKKIMTEIHVGSNTYSLSDVYRYRYFVNVFENNPERYQKMIETEKCEEETKSKNQTITILKKASESKIDGLNFMEEFDNDKRSADRILKNGLNAFFANGKGSENSKKSIKQRILSNYEDEYVFVKGEVIALCKLIDFFKNHHKNLVTMQKKEIGKVNYWYDTRLPFEIFRNFLFVKWDCMLYQKYKKRMKYEEFEDLLLEYKTTYTSHEENELFKKLKKHVDDVKKTYGNRLSKEGEEKVKRIIYFGLPYDFLNGLYGLTYRAELKEEEWMHLDMLTCNAYHNWRYNIADDLMDCSEEEIRKISSRRITQNRIYNMERKLKRRYKVRLQQEERLENIEEEIYNLKKILERKNESIVEGCYTELEEILENTVRSIEEIYYKYGLKKNSLLYNKFGSWL